MIRLCASALLLVSLVLAPGSALTRYQPSALDIFKLLPVTIFENTPEGLSDTEKQELIARSITGSWRLIPLGSDELRLESTPVAGSEVSIRLHHSRTTTVAAVGATSKNHCAVELWLYDAKGRLLPYPLPPEPGLEDFLATPSAIGKEINPSMQFCLAGDVLRVVPLFWDQKGPITIPLDMAVFYRWNGDGFEKSSIPISQLK